MTTTQKVAFITGAGKGIGLETAKGLGKKGVHVVLGVRKQSQGKTALDILRSEGISADLLVFDLSKTEDHQKAYHYILQKFGKLDMLINNAAVWLESTSSSSSVSNNVASLDAKILKDTFAINFFGTVSLTQTLLPLVKKSPAGRIVNVSSVRGSLSLNATPGNAVYDGKVLAYDSSKAALNMFTTHLAYALRDTQVKVNSIHPGWVRSDMGGANANLDLQQGSETSIQYALLGDDGPTGGFYFKDEVLPW
ncbi:SDR family oxidoreductase [Parapedobacter koreensis]|uniref:NAD(P)-dependent dehydrogenase, short-chain alcohol dehydrogenase family n=1 Tax=Parapedobacter koreensis TaxID=332977 RepID=A0A1H7IJ78_9SPHI|nr:SDR family oxidoreductase [Parapedobacter koreensis]SEK60755.1 NAD(P)-dependent dehydrogenase, short-chain alcohol dehydrogenase family [Parapedobacter koreensis]